MGREQDHHSSRRRSRSPRAESHKHRHRERSPHSHKHHRCDHKRKHSPPKSAPQNLPYNAPSLSKQDFEPYESLFADYLDIQKGSILEELEKSEVRGRFKSFIGKWNRGELAEGWYDPTRLSQSQQQPRTQNPPQHGRRSSPTYDNPRIQKERSPIESEDEGPGPALPNANSRERAGPSIPSFQDLEYKRELAAEDAHQLRTALKAERKLDSLLTKSQLESLVPTETPGTRARQLEKKRELALSNSQFAASKGAGDGLAEVAEADLMGGGEEYGIEGYKRKKMQEERKKNEREIRREEIMRARKEEREERAKQFKQREEDTMKGLVEIARRRFG